MTRRPFHGAAGITVVDFILLLAIVIMGIVVLFQALKYQKARYRKVCYENQQIADKLVWNVVLEEEKELPQLTSGYILRQEGGELNMVLIFLPGPGEDFPEKIVLDLNPTDFLGSGICPLHKKPPKTQAIIDYWYGAGRWWCFHNRYHN